jgi:general secretion pathway protein L
MRNMLLLRANSSDDQRWSWLHLDSTGEVRGVIHTGSLAEAAAQAEGLRVLVLMPATDCLLTSVNVPGRNRKKLLQAAPYALEEQLSDDVENLHFAIGAGLDDGSWQVAVINKQRMGTLMAALTEAGLDHDMAIVRSGMYSGYAVDSDNLGIVLAAGKQDDEDGAVLQLYVEQDVSPDPADYPVETRIEHYARDPLSIFAQGLDLKAINLLQGEFGQSGEWNRVWRPWRATAALLLASVLISNAAMAVDYYRLGEESDQLKMQI